jgi:hypothetical protein
MMIKTTNTKEMMMMMMIKTTTHKEQNWNCLRFVRPSNLGDGGRALRARVEDGEKRAFVLVATAVVYIHTYIRDHKETKQQLYITNKQTKQTNKAIMN